MPSETSTAQPTRYPTTIRPPCSAGVPSRATEKFPETLVAWLNGTPAAISPAGTEFAESTDATRCIPPTSTWPGAARAGVPSTAAAAATDAVVIAAAVRECLRFIALQSSGHNNGTWQTDRHQRVEPGYGASAGAPASAPVGEPISVSLMPDEQRTRATVSGVCRPEGYRLHSTAGGVAAASRRQILTGAVPPGPHQWAPSASRIIGRAVVMARSQ